LLRECLEDCFTAGDRVPLVAPCFGFVVWAKRVGKFHSSLKQNKQSLFERFATRNNLSSAREKEEGVGGGGKVGQGEGWG